MGIRRDIRLFRDSRFLRFLRADAVRSPRHPVDGHRWPSLAFGIMSLIFHAFDCGINAIGEFEDMRLWGIEWCSTWLSGTAGSGWSLLSSHRRALSWPRGAVTFSPHS